MILPSLNDYLSRKTFGNVLKEGSNLINSIEKNNDSSSLLISIITVVYNAEEHLQATIESVVQQTYPNIEYIIVDGGSTDKTLSIIKSYENFLSYWISEPDQGLYDAMNKGIALSHGSLIGLLNAGDTYQPNAIATIMERWRSQNFSQPIIFTGNCHILAEDHQHYFFASGDPSRLPLRMIPHAAVFVSKSVYESLGLFNLTLKIASDFEFLCRCYQAKIPFDFIDETLVLTEPRGVSGNYYRSEWDYAQVRLQYAFIAPWQAIALSLYSFVSITVHQGLKILGLWHLIEKRRYAGSR
ncbi:MAG: glycosyltransferase family 2 protein [Snowella sp.]|nr:glycosyltransferase family 2 protein [Snowella sp.]